MHPLSPMAFLHGISFLLQDYWSIDSASSYGPVEDQCPCSQKLWSQGTALPLTPDTNNCKAASSSIAERSCPDFNSVVWEWIKSELICKQWSITCVYWGCYLKPFHAHTAWLWLLSTVASKVLWLVHGPEVPWHVHCLGHLVYSLLA